MNDVNTLVVGNAKNVYKKLPLSIQKAGSVSRSILSQAHLYGMQTELSGDFSLAFTCFLNYF